MEQLRTDRPLVGQTMPNVTLKVFQAGKDTSLQLADYRGRWLILFFYPADFTFVCPTELVEMADLYSEFQKINTEVVSVSTDTVFVHKAWHDQSPSIAKITYPMAADPGGTFSKMLGTYLPDEGLSLRATMIIDPDGVVKAVEMHDNSIGRNAKELLRKLQAAQYVRDNGGEVCPASWTPGAATLKPGMGLVGKI